MPVVYVRGTRNHNSSLYLNHNSEMASSRNIPLSVALSMLDIPLPEDDDMSEDEFEGYIDADDDTADDTEVANGTTDLEDSSDDVPPIPDFQQPTGPSLDMTGKSPLDFFKLFVTDEMLDHVVEQTNIYADQYIDSTTLPPHSRVHGWRKQRHDRAELQKFLAMTITMGLVNYPHMEDYWSTSWPYATPSLSKVTTYPFYNPTHTK